MRHTRHLGIRTIGFQVVTEHSLPIGFLPGMDGVPVPVLDHVGAAGYVGVNVQAQLAIIGRELCG